VHPGAFEKTQRKSQLWCPAGCRSPPPRASGPPSYRTLAWRLRLSGCLRRNLPAARSDGCLQTGNCLLLSTRVGRSSNGLRIPFHHRRLQVRCRRDVPEQRRRQGRLALARQGKNNGFMGTAPCQSPITLSGTAILHVREDGLLQHNWVERSALEVHRSLLAS